jgi:serine/threonine protein kinase
MNLTSHNVLVTFHTKTLVSGFGLSKFKSLLRDEGHADGDRRLEWVAPELLSQPSPNVSPTQANVYSFGIILWEILTREHPHRLTARIASRLQLPFPRHHNLPVDYLHLIASCWRQFRTERPSFHELLLELSRLLD